MACEQKEADQIFRDRKNLENQAELQWTLSRLLDVVATEAAVRKQAEDAKASHDFQINRARALFARIAPIIERCPLGSEEIAPACFRFFSDLEQEGSGLLLRKCHDDGHLKTAIDEFSFSNPGRARQILAVNQAISAYLQDQSKKIEQWKNENEERQSNERRVLGDVRRAMTLAREQKKQINPGQLLIAEDWARSAVQDYPDFSSDELEDLEYFWFIKTTPPQKHPLWKRVTVAGIAACVLGVVFLAPAYVLAVVALLSMGHNGSRYSEQVQIIFLQSGVALGFLVGAIVAWRVFVWKDPQARWAATIRVEGVAADSILTHKGAFDEREIKVR